MILNDLSTVTQIFSLYNASISVPLYITCLITVFRYRKTHPFDSPFFAIYLAHGIIDLANFFDYFGPKFSSWGFFPSLYEPIGQPNCFAKINNFAIYTTGFIQYWIIGLVAANRYTAVCWPLRHLQIWNRHNVYILITVCYVVPALICTPILFTDVIYRRYLDYRNMTVTEGPSFSSISFTKAYGLIWGAKTCVLIFCSFFVYGSAFVTLIKQRNEFLTAHRKLEIKLFYAGFVLFFTCMLYFCFFASQSYISGLPNGMKYKVVTLRGLFLFGDLFNLNNAYVMLILCSELRHRVAALFNIHKNLVASMNTPF